MLRPIDSCGKCPSDVSAACYFYVRVDRVVIRSLLVVQIRALGTPFALLQAVALAGLLSSRDSATPAKVETTITNAISPELYAPR
jgi:hypothetical protein